MCHVCVTLGPQYLAPDNGFLQTGIIEEAASQGRGGGFHSLWDTPLPVHLLQVPREDSLGGRQQLDDGGPQPAEETVEAGNDNTGIEQGGGGCLYLGQDILGGCAVGPALRIRDMDD